MKSKKVCIVTVYNACNYGSFLQAYGLQKFLSENGYEPYFINMPVEYDKIIRAGLQSKEYSEYEAKKYEKLLANQKVFRVVDNVDESYVCSIVGSDTIWNFFDSTYYNIPYFVGEGLDGCDNIISYAASIGLSRISKLFLLRFSKIMSIRKFKAISVRDDRTEKLVKLIGRKAKRVLDPTFLVDFEVKKPEINIENPYILVYTYGLTSLQINSVKEYAKENNLKIIATGSLCEWADMNLAVDSFEWLWLAQNAKCIVTTTFHGTIFSIKYNKNFAVMMDNSAKINSLLKEFNLAERICNENTLSEKLNTLIDYSTINEIMSNRIDESKKFLLDNIGG